MGICNWENKTNIGIKVKEAYKEKKKYLIKINHLK